jgi:hypothetical protein
MECTKTYFSAHAVQRMFERGIRKSDIMIVLETGRIIKSYPEDTPFPSVILLGWIEGGPIHVIIGVDEIMRYCHIITVYVPDNIRWNEDYQTRKNL